MDTDTPECVDIIACENGQAFIRSLVLHGSGFGIVFIASGAVPACPRWAKYMQSKA